MVAEIASAIKRLRRHDAYRVYTKPPSPNNRSVMMGMITTQDGVEIFFKDWGPQNAQPIVFHHGWPLTRRRLGRADALLPATRATASSRMTAAAMAARARSATATTWITTPPTPRPSSSISTCKNAVHIGHSTGGGEATRYVAQHGQPQGRVAKLVLIGAVPPLMVKTAANPGGLPIEVFDGLRQQLAANRAQFYLDLPSGPFYGFNRPGAKAVAGGHPQLVAAGHDGRRQGPLRRHQGLLGDRLHRGPEERSTCRRS